LKPSARLRRWPSAHSGSARSRAAFLNLPFDGQYEELFVAFIAAMTAFGLVPHTVLEIPTSERRLDRILRLIARCDYSFHDLSGVRLDHHRPHATPRFNMPFELGLTVAWAKGCHPRHRWFVFEAIPFRLSKSLSDLSGTDPQIHHQTPEGVLRAVSNAMYRRNRDPGLPELRQLNDELAQVARAIKRQAGAGASLFESMVFRKLVTAASESRARFQS
jgi:hypothetical protein